MIINVRTLWYFLDLTCGIGAFLIDVKYIEILTGNNGFSLYHMQHRCPPIESQMELKAAAPIVDLGKL